jgi:hypothetical protein
MRLYLTAAGIYAGTQVEAKRDGKGWHEEIVPTDKTGLIDYLNALRFKEVAPPIPATHEEWRTLHEQQPVLSEPETAQDQQDEVLEEAAIREAFQRTVPQHRLAERAAFLGTSEEIALLADRIGELDGWPLGQVALAAASRLKELAE